MLTPTVSTHLYTYHPTPTLTTQHQHLPPHLYTNPPTPTIYRPTPTNKTLHLYLPPTPRNLPLEPFLPFF